MKKERRAARWNGFSKTYVRHLTAIGNDAVTKSNVIGLRKLLNAQARKDHGLSVSRAAPKITADEVGALQHALATRQPRVVGALHDSGIKLLQSPAFAKRWTPYVAGVIAGLAYFRLVGFDCQDGWHYVPIYRAFTMDGRSFSFRNVAWQSGGRGPEVLV